MVERSGFELPLLLVGAFRSLIDELHAELARQGHDLARPVHGFALQAIGPEGVTVSELGRRLGVSKQAAAKTANSLELAGYVSRVRHPSDARSWVLSRSPRGTQMLELSADIFDQLRDRWADQLGRNRLRTLESNLAAMARSTTASSITDLPGWLGERLELARSSTRSDPGPGMRAPRRPRRAVPP
jgi:DNA-binding MarR family transcriptional regulator